MKPTFAIVLLLVLAAALFGCAPARNTAAPSAQAVQTTAWAEISAQPVATIVPSVAPEASTLPRQSAAPKGPVATIGTAVTVTAGGSGK